jgi:hypothetical protein
MLELVVAVTVNPVGLAGVGVAFVVTWTELLCAVDSWLVASTAATLYVCVLFAASPETVAVVVVEVVTTELPS